MQSLIFCNIPEPKMVWIGEVEDAESLYDVITPASFTGKTNAQTSRIFKIAGGVRKIQAGELQK